MIEGLLYGKMSKCQGEKEVEKEIPGFHEAGYALEGTYPCL